MDSFNDESVFEKEQCLTILKGVVEETLQQKPYSHAKVAQWISEICEKGTKRLVSLGKPFKYVITTVIMQRNGAGLHTASSCFWDNANDGSCTFRYEEKTMYCVCTCFALAV
mmetsp:Transcript_42366/g.103820  ORF Transcript_42366/g.103820 Transcript_42366/m.103820 type:complete len:112 (-) Transcript_42366:521-856(-)